MHLLKNPNHAPCQSDRSAVTVTSHRIQRTQTHDSKHKTKSKGIEQSNDTDESRDQISTAPHKFTNVTFPRGFTPSQCALLASRQRSANYLYFTANESSSNKNAKRSDSKIKSSTRKKEKTNRYTVKGGAKPASKAEHRNDDISDGKRFVSLEQQRREEVTQVASTRYGSTKPVKQVLQRNSEALRDRSTKLQTCAGLKTGSSGYNRWKSSEEIARNLNMRDYTLLRLPFTQEDEEKLMEIHRAQRDLNFKKKKESYPPWPPVHLFDNNIYSTKKTRL